MQTLKDLGELVKAKLPPPLRSRLAHAKRRLEDARPFHYQDYRIPRKLMRLTGAPPETWHEISMAHMAQYERYCPIHPDHFVLEIGCGVGKDAIQLSQHLSPHGRYLGIDIIRPSIQWCQKNITSRYPNFEFHYFDVQSQIHNASGTRNTREIRLPVADGGVDRILLQSVFTHMFEADITHYLREFRRCLKPEGRVAASFFIVDEARLAKVRNQANLSFRFKYADGCYVETMESPEGAVAYTDEALERMMLASGLTLERPVCRGFWSGERDRVDGQDIVLMKRT